MGDMVMKSWGVMVVTFVFVLSTGAVAKQPCTLPDFGQQPESDWIFSGRHIYEDSAMGQQVKYTSESGGVADIYAYDMGLDRIEPDMVGALMAQTLKEIVNFARQYDPSMVPGQPRQLPQEYFPAVPGFATDHAFILSQSETAVKISILTMGSDGNCFYKVRYTVGADWPLGEDHGEFSDIFTNYGLSRAFGLLNGLAAYLPN